MAVTDILTTVRDIREESIAPPTALATALKEWSVTIRALREGCQVLLLRKGGILEEAGEFEVQARDVLLMPTYEHQTEQGETLQPAYRDWIEDEERHRPAGEMVRFHSWAHITDIVHVREFAGLYSLKSHHIYDDAFLRFRSETSPKKPLFALCLRVFELATPHDLPMEMDYYGCRSWVRLAEPISTVGARPVLSDAAYAEQVRAIRSALGGTA